MSQTQILELVRPLTKADRDQYRFRRQWVLRPRGDEVEMQWPSYPISGTHVLHCHPDLRVRAFHAGQCTRLLLGLAVVPDGGNLEQLLGCEGGIETNLRDIAGTYVVIEHDEASVRIYTDPGGMMGTYWRDGRAASSPGLIPGVQRDEHLDAVFPFGGTDDWYPGSLCPFVGVRWLLANHVLDLAKGTVRRFWPLEAPAPLGHDEGLARAAHMLRATMTEFVAAAPCLISLTGGRDSRVNLAAAREIVDQIRFFTIRSPGVKKCDLEVPAKLAERFDLDHRFVDEAPAEPWLFELYDEISAGMAIGARRDIVATCNRIASDGYVHVTGNLGAITKSFFWHSPRPKSVKRRALVKEFVNKPPEIRAAIDEWLDSVPALPPTMVYNLMYLEQRGGRWMGIGETASNLFYESVTPFNSRRLFEIVSAMPTESLHGGQLLVEFVRELWPELLEVPYCTVTRNWGTYVPRRWKSVLRRMAKLGKR